MSIIVLHPWEWIVDSKDEASWRAPGGTAIGVLDRRSNTQSGIAGGVPQGAGFFSYPDRATLPSGALNLGSDIERMLTSVERDGLLRLANIQAQSTDSVLEAIYGSFLNPVNYDPAGLTNCKPLRISRRSGLKCYLGGFGHNGLIINEKFNPTHVALTATLAVRFEDYRRNREDADSLREPERTIRIQAIERWTGFDMRKLFGRMDDDLLSTLVPPEYLNSSLGRDGWRVPATIINESFNQGDSTTLGPDLSWTEDFGSGDDTWETVSNVARRKDDTKNTQGDRAARADTDLSSDDHYGQIDVVTLTTSVEQGGPTCRVNASTTVTYYRVTIRDNNGGEQFLQKVISSTVTTLAGATLFTISLPDTLRVEANGTTIRGLRNTVQIHSETDSGISGNLRCGIYGVFSTGNVSEVDIFEAADLAAAVARRRLWVGGGGRAMAM